MTIQEAKQALNDQTPVEFLSHGGWLEPGWHTMSVSAIDENEDAPRVWLRYGLSGGVGIVGKKDIRERLRVKE